MEASRSSLKYIIESKNNNLDLFRLICALLVIYGHAETLSPPLQANYSDFIYSIVGVHSHSLAVYVFFFMSGLLVTNSLATNKNVIKFITARLFRIYPALIMLLFVSSLVIGPLLTNIGSEAYLHHPVTYQYISRNLLMHVQFQLPGMFEGNAYKAVVNGSLWTLKYEIIAYFTLCSIFILNLLDRRLFLMILGVVILDICSDRKMIFTDTGAPMYLALDFCMGATLALWKDDVIVNFKLILALVIIWIIFRENKVGEILLHTMVFASVLYLSANVLIRKINIKYDVSYGVYLYGFLVAQILAQFYPTYDIWWHQLIAMCISVVIGLISALLVERPVMKLGKSLGSYLSQLFDFQYRKSMHIIRKIRQNGFF